MDRGYSQAEAQASLKKLQKRLGIEPAPRTRSFTAPARYLGIAAALVVAIFGAKYLSTSDHGSHSAPETKTYSTGNGQRATVTLSDGSNVTLAPATTMRVTDRDVDLKGEAVFTVSHSSEGVFTVHANGAAVRVLGTTFGVRAYDELRVAVSEGRVSVASAVLSAGDMATIRDNTTTIRQNVDVASLLAWTRGSLAFNDTPLSEASHDLERWLDIKVRIDDQRVAAYPISATFGKNSPSQVAEILSDILNVPVHANGREIVIGKRR